MQPGGIYSHSARMPSSGTEQDEDGNPIQKLPWKEKLPHHARYVIMTVLEWDHFSKCKSKSRKAWASGLRPGYNLPHRNTCIK
eukprot:1429833-Prymnesium_polylepis.1